LNDACPPTRRENEGGPPYLLHPRVSLVFPTSSCLLLRKLLRAPPLTCSSSTEDLLSDSLFAYLPPPVSGGSSTEPPAARRPPPLAISMPLQEPCARRSAALWPGRGQDDGEICLVEVWINAGKLIPEARCPTPSESATPPAASSGRSLCYNQRPAVLPRRPALLQ
jgi:hypothetical protein